MASVDEDIAKMLKGITERNKVVAEKYKQEIDALKDINAPIFSNGNTILLEFAEQSTGHYYTPETITYLISKGANVNAKNKDGDTALMLLFKNATKQPPAQIYSILLNAPGLDINATNNKGSTASNFLDAVIYYPNNVIVNELKDFIRKKGIKLKFGTPVLSKDEILRLAKESVYPSQINDLIIERASQHPIYSEAAKVYMNAASRLAMVPGVSGSGLSRRTRKNSKKLRKTRKH